MAKSDLKWFTVNVATSKGNLPKLVEAENAAMEATNAEVAKRAAAHLKVDVNEIRVGRNWGKLSFAHDPAAKTGNKATTVAI